MWIGSWSKNLFDISSNALSILIDWYLKSRTTQISSSTDVEDVDDTAAQRQTHKKAEGKQINIQKQYLRKNIFFPNKLLAMRAPDVNTPLASREKDEKLSYLPSYNLFVNNFGDIWWFFGKEKFRSHLLLCSVGLAGEEFRGRAEVKELIVMLPIKEIR